MIIIKEFLAGLDVAHGINEDAVVFLDRFAVRIAGMIDPARVVTANFWIDNIAVFQTEVESVWIVGVVRGGFPGDAFARVLDNARAFGNELRGINAPAVHTGRTNLDLYGSLPSFAFLRHTQCGIVLVLNSAWAVTALFFNGAAYFTQVFPERITRIGGALLQISREVQLFAQRAPALDRLRLTPFSFPDFVCD